MKHELKTRHEFFKVAWAGNKPFEIRRNDRNFDVHDEVVLQEIDDDGELTGREIHGFISYITKFEQQEGYVVFSYSESSREGA